MKQNNSFPMIIEDNNEQKSFKNKLERNVGLDEKNREELLETIANLQKELRNTQEREINDQKSQEILNKKKDKQIADLTSEINKLEEEKKQWQIKENKLTKGLEASYEVFRNKDREIKILNQTINGLNKNLEKDQEEAKSLKGRVEKIPDLKRDLKNSNELYEKQLSRNTELTSEIEKLKKLQVYYQNQNYPQQIQTKEKLIDDAITKYQELDNKYNSVNRTLSSKDNEITNWQEKNKVLEDKITEFDNTINKLNLAINQKDGELLKVNNELKNTRESNNFLKKLCDEISGKKKGMKWYANRDAFIQIINNNLPAERIKSELGDISKGWLSDNTFELLSKEAEKKLKDYDELGIKDLPKDWKDRLDRLDKFESGQSDYKKVKEDLDKWNTTFKNKTPAEIDAIIKDFRAKVPLLAEIIWKHTHLGKVD